MPVYKKPKSDDKPDKKGKKSRHRRKKKVRRLSRVLIIFFVFILTVGFGAFILREQQDESRTFPTLNFKRKSGVTVNVHDDTGLLTESEKETVRKYAEMYGETILRLEVREITSLYEDPYGNAAVLNDSAFRTLVKIRKMSDIDLRPEYIIFDYTVDSKDSWNGNPVVTITEKTEQKFKHMSEPSYTDHARHFFVFSDDGGGKIETHLEDEDFYLLALQAMEDLPQRQRTAENISDILLSDAGESVRDQLSWQSNSDIPRGNYQYDRDGAIDYAKQFWNTANLARGYEEFDDYGGNCQNFVSQCLRAGGLEMDYSGPAGAQWKWYGIGVNESRTPSGRSYSWTGVDAFYNYAVADYSKNMVCTAEVPLSMAEKGDVLQFGAYDEWRHSVLITDIIYNRDGSVKDMAIASNTADRWNWPARAYVYKAHRIIHISGNPL